MLFATLILGQATASPVRATLEDVSGVACRVPAPNRKATVLFFVGVDCPIANRMAPEISRICRDYAPRGVMSFLVYPDAGLKAPAVKAHMKAYQIAHADAIVDGKLALVHATGATVTPQAVIIDPTGAVRYSGRINDLYEEHGRIKPNPTRNDLRVALDELLAGRAVSQPRTQLVGCFIGGN